jgi:hypothetical protein
MGQVVELAVALYTIDCGSCGGTYAINRRFRDMKVEKGGFWHCPYCECSWGYAESENTRLKRELEEERKRKDAALSRANVAEQAKTKAERKLKRVTKGVCTECNRTFRDLAEHMACKHPEDGKPKFRKRAKPPAFESG